MADLTQARPYIHVCLTSGADEALYRWVEIGAEEESLPTRKIEATENDPIAAAYGAAQSSRFGIGVSITPNQVTLHETHMPPTQPVLLFAFGSEAQRFCRLMGSNAARLVVRLPLRFEDEPETLLNTFNEVKKPQTISKTARSEEYSTSGQPQIEALARAIASKCRTPSAALQPVEAPAGAVGEIDAKLVTEIVVRILRERGIP